MTDRELLELAAKAAGVEGQFTLGSGNALELAKPRGFQIYWNPLTDDGDAFRLAVKLDIEFLPDYTMDGRGVLARERNNVRNEDFCLYVKEGIYSATRRAIVGVAAQIGKRMGSNNDSRK